MLTTAKVSDTISGLIFSFKPMSEDQLKAFLQAVSDDVVLREKFNAAGDFDAVVSIAKAAGFAFSVVDLQKARLEISEDQLEGLSGGRASHRIDLAGLCTDR